MNKRQLKKNKKKSKTIRNLLMVEDEAKTKEDIRDDVFLHNNIKSIVYVPENEREEKALKDAGIPYLKEWRELKQDPEKFIGLNRSKLEKARIKIK